MLGENFKIKSFCEASWSHLRTQGTAIVGLSENRENQSSLYVVFMLHTLTLDLDMAPVLNNESFLLPRCYSVTVPFTRAKIQQTKTRHSAIPVPTCHCLYCTSMGRQ